jgi:hypothetical protein
MPAPAPLPVPAWASPLAAEDLVVLALAAGCEDSGLAVDRIFAAADGSRDRLGAVASLLIERLKLRSDDMEASLALSIVERALVRAPYPDGPWRWAHSLRPRRLRAAERRRRRAVRRRRTGTRWPDRANWRRRRGHRLADIDER